MRRQDLHERGGPSCWHTSQPRGQSSAGASSSAGACVRSRLRTLPPWGLHADPKGREIYRPAVLSAGSCAASSPMPDSDGRAQPWAVTPAPNARSRIKHASRRVSGSIFSGVTGNYFLSYRRNHDSAFKNEYQDIPGGKDGRCVGVTTLPPSQCRKSRKSEALTYRIPKGLSGPAHGKEYVYIIGDV